MAKKTTQKQQRHAQKRRKERALRRRELQAGPRLLLSGAGSRAPAPAARRPRMSADEQALRDRIQKFAYQPRFQKDFDRAMPLFFGEEVARTRTVTAEEAEMAEFQEWFIGDFITAAGERIIDLFAREIGPSLPPNQFQLLEDWRRTNRQRLIEVQEVRPGIGETIQELLSGEVFDFNDISMSYAAKRWQIALARTILTEGRWSFAGGGRLFTPFEKEDLLDFARHLWQEYQREHPNASLADFYRDRSLELHRFAVQLQANPPSREYITPEGHELLSATAEYRVRDADAIMRLLDRAEEFNYAGPDQKNFGAEHYNWLLRGRSFVPEAAERPKKALQLRTEWTRGPGYPTYRSLGDIVVWPNRLELSSVSRERLQAGKALLEQLLGDLVLHRRDRFRDIEQLRAESSAKSSAEPAEAEVPDEVAEALTQEMMESALREWLDTPIPAFGHQTAREAVKSAEGRAAVEESLKQFEYVQERNKEQGKHYVDVRLLRRQLGLL